MPDSDVECIHGIVPFASCSICNGNQPAARPRSHFKPWKVSWEGPCGGCDEPITSGQTAVWRNGDLTYHLGCQPGIADV